MNKSKDSIKNIRHTVLDQSENSESLSGAGRQLVSPTKNLGQVSDSSVVQQMIYSLIKIINMDFLQNNAHVKLF